MTGRDDDLARLEDVWRTQRGWRFFSSVNNTNIGLLYIGTALLFFILAGVLGLLMRVQLAVPSNGFLGAETYNQVFTMHGSVMMFLFAIPIVEAIAVYLLPTCWARATCRSRACPRTPTGPMPSAASRSSAPCSSASRRMAAGSCIRR
jgi:hypothetical protein